MKVKVLRVLDVLILALLCVSFMIEVLVIFDGGFCFAMRKVGQNPNMIGVTAGIIALVAVLLSLGVANARSRKSRAGMIMILASILAVCCTLGLRQFSPYQTMRPGFDKDLSIDEYGSIVGEKLGTYAISIPTYDLPVKLYWQCSSVTSYGPIRYGDEMDEFFLTVDSGDVLVMSVNEYADGVWITIKEFILDCGMLPIYIGEDDTEIMAGYLDSIPHEIVDLSGKTDAEISQILEAATWDKLIWTTDELEESKEDLPRL